MKTLRKPLMYVALALLPMLFSKCTLTEDLNKLQSAVDSVQLFVSTPEFNTGVHFEFVDAATNEPISDKDVSVTITGQDAALVFNNIGGKEELYYSKWGMLDMVIDPHKVNATDLEANPILFELNASLAGYQDATQSVAITQADRQTVVVSLVNTNNPPEGTTISEEKTIGTITENGLAQDIVVDFEPAASLSAMKRAKSAVTPSNISPSFTLPKGIKLYSMYGGILTGEVSATYTTVNFPIGGNATKPLGRQSVTGYNLSWMFFQEYGSVQMSLFVKDKGYKTSVSEIKGGIIKMNLALPSNFINPETKKTVKENDILKRFTQSNKSNSDNIKNINGILNIEAELKEYPFSTQKWGHLIPVCSYSNDAITMILNLQKIRGLRGACFYDITSKNIPTFKSSGYCFFAPNTGSKDNNFHQKLYSLPEGQLEVSSIRGDEGDGRVFTPNSFTISNSCEPNKSYEVEVTENPSLTSDKWVTANINLTLTSATNKKLIIKPNAWIYTEIGELSSRSQGRKLLSGAAQIPIMIGEKYSLFANFGNEFGTAQFIVESEASGRKKVTISNIKFHSNQTSTVPITYYSENNKVININYIGILPDNIINQMKSQSK